MNAAMKKTTIEGLISPAALAAGTQKSNAAPVFKVDLRRSLRMHPTAAICAGAAVFLFLVVFGLTRKPMYVAKSLTYVEPLTKSVLSDGTGAMFDPSRYDSYLQQQMQTATRPDILEAALAKLPPGTWQQPGETTQTAAARLQSALKVERVTTSYQLAISLTGPDPVATAATVNAVTDAYLAQGRHDEHLVTDQRLKLLSEERQRIQTEMDQDRTEQTALGQVLGVANPVGESANPYDLQLANVRGELQSARQAHDVAAAQLASVRNEAGARSPGMVASADELIANDAGLSSMKSTINSRKALLSTQMAGLTPSNPVYKQDQDEIVDLDRSLDSMTTELRDKAERRLEDKLGLELRRTGDIEGRLNEQLAQQTATATSAGPRLQRAAELAADLVRLTTRYATVDDAMRGMELEANGPGLAHLSVAATVPVSPEASRKRLLLLAALPLALIAACFTAVLLHKRDPRVYTSRDLEETLGFMPIGVLPARAEVSEAVMEEYLLRLAAGLENAYRVSAARSYVFTAASSQTDVSDFIEALSRKLRQLGLTALIVEASRLLQPVLAADGMGEMMRPVTASHEGFATTNLERLKSDHDLLLIDAPPLLHSAETEYSVRCADATILVAESGRTLRGELTQSASLLERLNAVGVGAVLAEVHLASADARFRSAIAVLESRPQSRTESPFRSRSETVEPAVAEPVAGPEAAEPVREVAAAERVGETVERKATPVVEVVEAPLAVEREELPVAGEPVVARAAAAVRVPVVVTVHEPVVHEDSVHEQTAKLEPLSFAEANDDPELETEQKKGWLKRLFGRDEREAVSILPEDRVDTTRRTESVAVLDEAAAPMMAEMSQRVVIEPVYDIEPRQMDVAPVAASTMVAADETYAAAAVVEVESDVVQAVEIPSMQTAAEPEMVAAPVAESAAAAPAEAFVQSFEVPVFTREFVPAVKPVVVPKVAATPATVRVEKPLPSGDFAVAAAAVRPFSVEPAAAAALPAREPLSRRPEPRPMYVPPVLPAMPVQARTSEPITTGRWEPVRTPRSESVQTSASSLDGLLGSSNGPAERGVSRISGGRRAALEPRLAEARIAELRNAEMRNEELRALELQKAEARSVRNIPATGWVPPMPAPRNVNPLGDDGLQPRTGSLTRRWELLSRFDRGVVSSRAADEGEPVLAGQGRSMDERTGR